MGGEGDRYDAELDDVAVARWLACCEADRILVAMGVKDIPVDGTAYAHRNSKLLCSNRETMMEPA